MSQSYVFTAGKQRLASSTNPPLLSGQQRCSEILTTGRTTAETLGWELDELWRETGCGIIAENNSRSDLRWPSWDLQPKCHKMLSWHGFSDTIMDGFLRDTIAYTLPPKLFAFRCCQFERSYSGFVVSFTFLSLCQHQHQLVLVGWLMVLVGMESLAELH